MNFHGDHVQIIQQAMSDVVNGPGTAGRARLPIENVLMAGKTGTAQVVGLNVGGGKGGQWKYRDHGLFIFFAPFDKPRYAGAVVIEHGGGSGAAYPIARDVMTFLFDPAKGLEALHALEKQWGGTAQQRLDARLRALRRRGRHRRAARPGRSGDDRAPGRCRGARRRASRGAHRHPGASRRRPRPSRRRPRRARRGCPERRRDERRHPPRAARRHAVAGADPADRCWSASARRCSIRRPAARCSRTRCRT